MGDNQSIRKIMSFSAQYTREIICGENELDFVVVSIYEKLHRIDGGIKKNSPAKFVSLFLRDKFLNSFAATKNVKQTTNIWK